LTRRFLDALRAPGRLWSVELRPPGVDLSAEGSVDAWIDLDRGVRSLLGRRRYVLFTDAAVGAREEESLQHLATNLGPNADLSHVVPFLTCKHTLEYCLLFARRAASRGIAAITVTGGDSSVGAPRCVPRSRDLRALIRAQVPGVALGAWVNPYKDPVKQVDLLTDRGHEADYFLTQVVSHHEMAPVDRFLEEAARRGLAMPGLFGVFYYRSGNRNTLERLSRFIPAPVEGLLAEFADGRSADDVCALTLEALAARGVDKVYISNLQPLGAERRLGVLEGLVRG
jgi:5,10-methylenetetrahydrofolate reductase